MSIELFWDTGSAYDLFTSLFVLHHPEDFGLRPSWAAGVRSRLGASDRIILEKAFSFLPFPFRLLAGMPGLKDARAGLDYLETILPADRLDLLMIHATTPESVVDLLHRVGSTGHFSEADLDTVRKIYIRRGRPVSAHDVANLLDAWASRENFGEQYLIALRGYYDAFFFEEENRVSSAQKRALAMAQQMARELPVPDLLEKLSHGVSFTAYLNVARVTLIPSYWSNPLIFFNLISPDHLLILYGGRPETESLIPGEVVPEGLLNVLKGLADPTRLQILKYLVEQPLTPKQLAQKLRLRPPTVIHHLKILRLAGLVWIRLENDTERCYAARIETLTEKLTNLQDFLAN